MRGGGEEERRRRARERKRAEGEGGGVAEKKLRDSDSACHPASRASCNL